MIPKSEDFKLSPHFKASEFTNTSRGSDYIKANFEFVKEKKEVMEDLCNKILEPIREHLIRNYGLPYMTITSGVRCPALNKIIGGATTSQHCHAEACDFIVDGAAKNTKSVFEDIINGKVKNLDLNQIGQCILERSVRANGSKSYWIHISILTERFKKARIQSGRSGDGKEFLVTLTGKTGSYQPASPEMLAKYE